AVTQSRAIVHDDPNDPDEAAGSSAVMAAGLVDVDLTITDGDGDTATDSVDLGSIIKFEDDGPGLEAGGADIGNVSEAAALPSVDTGSIGVDFGSDGAGDVTDITGPAGLTSGGVNITYDFDPVTNTLTGSAGVTPIFTVTIDPATGQY